VRRRTTHFNTTSAATGAVDLLRPQGCNAAAPRLVGANIGFMPFPTGQRSARKLKVTVAMEAVGNKIRLDSQSWEGAEVISERQALMVVAIKGQLYLLPELRPAKFERIDHDGLAEAGYGPEDFE
jgi:hypothetical protein